MASRYPETALPTRRNFLLLPLFVDFHMDPSPIEKLAINGTTRRALIETAFVYLGLVSFGLAQPLFNTVELFRREFQMDVVDLVLIVLCFQFAVTGMLVAGRWAMRRWGKYLDYLVYFAAAVSLLRQIQLNYVHTESMSRTEKMALALAILAAAAVAIALFRRFLDRFVYYAGMMSPVFGLFFLYVMVTQPYPVDAAELARVGAESSPASAAPVILVVMDEFSLTLLLDDSGDIDGRRYPAFRRLAHDSVWFRQAMSNYPGTSQSFPSFLEGTYRVDDKAAKIPDDIEAVSPSSLPGTLKAHGYRVAVATNALGCGGRAFECRRYLSGSSNAFLWRVFAKFVQEFGPDYLVDQYLPWLHGGMLHFENENLVMLGRGAKPGQMYLVHLMTSHAPYVLNENGGYAFTPHLRLAKGSNFSGAFAAYRRQLRYQDKVLGRFLDSLQASGLYDTAVIAVTADYGNCWSRDCPGRVNPAQIQILEPSLPRVPMFLRAPGVAPRIDDGDSQLVDLAPTLLDAAKVPYPPEATFDGRSALRGIDAARPRLFFLVPGANAIDIGLPVERRIIAKVPRKDG